MNKYFIYFEIQRKNAIKDILAEGNLTVDINNFDLTELVDKTLDYSMEKMDFVNEFGIKKEDVICIIKFITKVK